MAVDPIGLATSGATVITSAAIALSQQVRQNLSAQVEQAAQKTKEPESTEQQGKPAVEEGSESAKTNDPCLSGLHPHPLGLEWAQTGYRGARHGCSRPRRSPIPAFATRVPATFPR